MATELKSTEELDSCPPGGTKGGRGDVLFRLNAIHADMHAGKDYGFAQSIWCDAVKEVSTLRQMLDASHHPACKHRKRGIGAPGCICRTVRKVPMSDDEQCPICFDNVKGCNHVSAVHVDNSVVDCEWPKEPSK